MKLILTLMIFAISNIALADAWKLESEKEYEGTTVETIQKIAEKFPEILFDGDVNVSDITYLLLMDQTFKFKNGEFSEVKIENYHKG